MIRSFMRILFCTLLTAAAIWGQATSGEITGVITDATKAVVPSARLTATNVDTGTKLTVDSNEAGIYRLSPLPVGTYDLTVEKGGFSPFKSERVVVNTAMPLETCR